MYQTPPGRPPDPPSFLLSLHAISLPHRYVGEEIALRGKRKARPPLKMAGFTKRGFRFFRQKIKPFDCFLQRAPLLTMKGTNKNLMVQIPAVFRGREGGAGYRKKIP